MRFFLFISTLMVISTAGWAEPSAQERLDLIMQCRNQTSSLERLVCYDQALSNGDSVAAPESIPLQQGKVWRRAMAQEQTRKDHSTLLLLTQSEGDNPSVILTAPAIGHPPPRPVLMFSCIDNITRLQVALVSKQKEGAGGVALTTDRTRFNAQWFVRENGYVLESSRGLAGIEEIKRLFDANALTLSLQNGGSLPLRFDISQLAQSVKPLRAACHW